MRWAIVVVGLAVGVSGAQAQSLAVVPQNTSAGLPAVIDPATQFLAFNRAVPGGTEIGSASVALPAFTEYLRGQIGQPAPMSVDLAGIANRIDRLSNRFAEGIALAGSINVLPPNPGDRFAVSFGGAGYDGAGAGSVAVSARLREDIIAYGAVARGPTRTLVKGGLGLSFR